MSQTQQKKQVTPLDCIVGLVVKQVERSADRRFLRITTECGSRFHYVAESHIDAWFDSLTQRENLIGRELTDVKAMHASCGELIERAKRTGASPYYEDVYAYRIWTTAGWCLLWFRNSESEATGTRMKACDAARAEIAAGGKWCQFG